MDGEKTIKVKSSDGKVIELSTKAASRSKLLSGIIEDYPEDSEFPLNKINGETLEKVKEYLSHYQDSEPRQIEKPLQKDFKDCVDEWDYKFIGDDNSQILALIFAANFMDIKPLLELAAAKVATLIRGTTTESIRKDFDIKDISEEEDKQMQKDKSYLEKNL
jgi:S-phase kinase-associated protein 1